MIKVELSEQEVEYIVDLIYGSKESLDDCCEDDGTVLADFDFIKQEDADEEYRTIYSLLEKLGGDH